MDERELRQAVIDNRREDRPRLEYAALCDAHGEKAHGDYIRAAVARALVDRHGAEAERLFQEELRALRARPKDADWRPGFTAIEARYRASTGIDRVIFSYDDQRGFMASVGGRLPDIVAVADELFAAEPIERLSLWFENGTVKRETAADARKLAEMPLLAHVRTLSFQADLDLIQALKQSAFLGNLERLSVWGGENPDVEACLTELIEGLSRSFAGVKKLQLSGLNFRAQSAERLCASNAARQWERLALEGAALGDAGADVLAAATLGNVKELWLCENGITADGVKSLADSAGLARVRDLDLGKNTIDAEGMQRIAERKNMKGLARLGIEDSVREKVYEQWTEWDGGHLGGDYAIRPMSAAAVAGKYPLAGVVMYAKRVGD